MPLTIRQMSWRIGLVAAGCAVAVTIGGVELYRHTKEAYRAVGFNDGVVAANVEAMDRITNIVGTIKVCTTAEQSKAREIFAAKTEALYLVANGGGSTSFCRSR